MDGRELDGELLNGVIVDAQHVVFVIIWLEHRNRWDALRQHDRMVLSRLIFKLNHDAELRRVICEAYYSNNVYARSKPFLPESTDFVLCG